MSRLKFPTLGLESTRDFGEELGGQGGGLGKEGT